MLSSSGEIGRLVRLPLIITSIFGNLAMLIVLLRYHSLRKYSSNMLIAQLGFADIILGIGLLIHGAQIEIYEALNIELSNRGACVLYSSMTILGMTMIQVTIIMVTFDRLCVLVFPILYRHHADNMQLSMIRFIVNLLISLASYFGQFIHLPFYTNVEKCSSEQTWTAGYRLYFMIFCSCTSLLTIVLNALTMLVYWRKMRLSSRQRKNYVVIAQTTITLSYIVFWCVPSMLYLVAIVLGIRSGVFGDITLLLSIGSGFFASLNPFLFLWKHTEFREFFFRFYRLRRLKKQSSNVKTTVVPTSMTVVAFERHKSPFIRHK
ncbi:hypothetical protein Tcan_09986 [Toxocara canis]|uniref:G-protein coupled receptors family 1 profile domain-containing protein n=1 Tax=Toxocara canis TaxID=6265 RepID=A0A0B2UUM5_TOXCA|nr:hypothetical protein Tcan_09986 [Toxocara canis]